MDYTKKKEALHSANLVMNLISSTRHDEVVSVLVAAPGKAEQLASSRRLQHGYCDHRYSVQVVTHHNNAFAEE